MNTFVSEFIGSFIIMLGVLSLSNPLYLTSVFLAAITISGPISGGHINPAVSLAMFLKGSLNVTQLSTYVSAQVLGVITALMLYNTFLR
jgi:aquaporin Z